MKKEKQDILFKGHGSSTTTSLSLNKRDLSDSMWHTLNLFNNAETNGVGAVSTRQLERIYYSDQSEVRLSKNSIIYNIKRLNDQFYIKLLYIGGSNKKTKFYRISEKGKWALNEFSNQLKIREIQKWK